jgi:hypothetical protein
MFTPLSLDMPLKLDQNLVGTKKIHDLFGLDHAATSGFLAKGSLINDKFKWAYSQASKLFDELKDAVLEKGISFRSYNTISSIELPKEFQSVLEGPFVDNEARILFFVIWKSFMMNLYNFYSLRQENVYWVKQSIVIEEIAKFVARTKRIAAVESSTTAPDPKAYKPDGSELHKGAYSLRTAIQHPLDEKSWMFHLDDMNKLLCESWRTLGDDQKYHIIITDPPYGFNIAFEGREDKLAELYSDFMKVMLQRVLNGGQIIFCVPSRPLNGQFIPYYMTSELLKQEDIYIHVDAASGGFAFVSDIVKSRMDNLDSADSFAVDPHKMGFLHYPCGAVVFRDRGFREQIYHEAPYLGPLAPTLEGSRPGGPSAALWLALETIGLNGYRLMIDHLLAFVETLSASFAKSREFQVLHRTDLNAMAVAPLPKQGESRQEVNQLIRAVRQRIFESSDFLVNIDRHLSAVKVRNEPFTKQASEFVDIEALRIVVTNPLVRLEDADILVTELVGYLAEERDRKRKGYASVSNWRENENSLTEEP